MSAPPRRILVVDDEPAILEALSEVLVEEGYSVETAANGALALQRLDAAAPRPDVVLTDLMMPVMDGRALAAEVRRRPALHGLHVVAMSAGLLHPSERGHFAHFLPKPFELTDLLTVLSRVTGEPQVRQPG